MIAEFASANAENESGIHSWLASVLGERWAFWEHGRIFLLTYSSSVRCYPIP